MSTSSALSSDDADDDLSLEGWLTDVSARLRRNDPSLIELEIGQARSADDDEEDNTDRGDDPEEEEEEYGLNLEHVRNLSDSLRKNRTLRRLKLNHVAISQDMVLYLAPALKKHSTLQILELEDCFEATTDQDDDHDPSFHRGDGLVQLLSLALSRNSSIQTLNLFGNWPRTSADYMSLTQLSLVFSMAPNLSEVRLCHNHIDAATVQALSLGMRDHGRLRYLDLTGNSMDDAAIASLADAFRKNGHVQFLSLDFNGFGDVGVAALAEMLQVNHCLSELHLFGNRVTGVGAEHLAEALCHNYTLESLILSFNQIGDRGATALAHALTINTTLTKIWLPSNAVGNEGMHAIADHLPQMKGLEQLDLGLLLDDDAAMALVAALKFNLRLSVLHMEKPVYFDYEEEEATPPLADMDFYLRLNRSGRRLLRDPQVPSGLWAIILARASRLHHRRTGAPDVLHYLLHEKPDLLDRTIQSPPRR